MWNARLDESQTRIKISRKNVNNLSYAEDTTLMAESEEELKILMKVKEESEIAGLKLNIQKTKIMASSPISSVQFSRSVMSDSLRLLEPQHARPPCPSPTLGVHPNPCPLSWWCHPTISSSVVSFSSCLQSFPASWSFQMSQLFTSGAKVLEFQLQYQSYQWIFRTNFL